MRTPNQSLLQPTVCFYSTSATCIHPTTIRAIDKHIILIDITFTDDLEVANRYSKT